MIVALVPDSLDERDLRIHYLFDIPGGVFVGLEHPLCRHRSVPLAELAKYKWIALETETADDLSRRFGPFDVRAPEVPVRTDSPAMMEQLLVVSQLVGMAPLQLSVREAETGELVRLANEPDPLTARGCLAYRKDTEQSPQMAQSIETLPAAICSTITPTAG